MYSQVSSLWGVRGEVGGAGSRRFRVREGEMRDVAMSQKTWVVSGN